MIDRTRAQCPRRQPSPGDLQRRVTATATDRVEQLGLPGVLRPKVTVSREKAR